MKQKSSRTGAAVAAKEATAAAVPATGNASDEEYDMFRQRMQLRFLANTYGKGKGVPLFTTEGGGLSGDALWQAYLAAMPEGERQFHVCNACRRFICRYGALVTIDESGKTHSAVWEENDAPAVYEPAIAAMIKLVRRAKVTGVFLSKEATWGTPETGPWRHVAVRPEPSLLYRGMTLTAGQAMAEKREDFKNVSRAIGEFPRPVIETAMRLLKSELLYRSEKVIGPAQWLMNLHTARESVRGNARANVVWLAVATAPSGFCHPRASMIGTILEDIAAGMDFEEVSRRFKAKMSPTLYHRPQAAPTAGNIAQGEKLVEQMGIAPSLARRFARLDEIEALWRYAPAPPPMAEGVGVFSHLKPKGASLATPAIDVPPIVLTWEKFARTVLPEATAIDFFVPRGYSTYCALVTAEDADAPPILQWDREERRNPFSWYVYPQGSDPARWGIIACEYRRVTAVTLRPSMWHGGGFDHHGEGVIFLMEGAKDTRNAGLSLFPEILRSELHGVRATIEAFSRNGTIGGKEEASACGLMLQKGVDWDARFRVTTAAGTQEYRLDRWD